MKKIFQTKNYGLIRNLYPIKHINPNRLCSSIKFSLYNNQNKNFVEKSIFTRFLDLRRKLDGLSFVSKSNEHKVFNKRDLEEAENIFLSVIESKDKTKILEMVREIKTILFILTKNKTDYKPIQDIVFSIFKELQGEDFPFFLVPEYLIYLYTIDKKELNNFPPNFVADFEKQFYEKAMMLKIRELSLLFLLNKILNNQFSSNFVPFLEKIILLNINDEKFLYIKSSDLIMADLRRYALLHASNKFLDEYLNVYLRMLTMNSINYKELNYLLRSLNRKIKLNYFDFELREIILNFMNGCKEFLQNIIDDESFYEQDLLFAFLLIAKNNFVTGIFSKNFYNTIVKKVITKDINKLSIIILMNYLNDLPNMSSENIEKLDLHLVHILKQFKELRDFYLALKYAKKYNNPVLVDIIFLQITKFLLDKGEVDTNYLNSIYNFKQTYKLQSSINRFSITVLDLYIKKNSKRSISNVEKMEEKDLPNVENSEETNLNQ